MSIVKAVSGSTTNKLVIPCAGKMFRSNISDNNKALCFCLNKGYFQSLNLDAMLHIKQDFKDPDFVFVGNIDMVRLNGSNKIVYRQRIFFKSFIRMLNRCKFQGVRVDVDPNFHISINNVLNCVDDLKYLERYAKKFNESIETYLTRACLIQINEFLLDYDMVSNLNQRVKKFLLGKTGYLDRAPYLVGSYNIDNHTSSLVLSSNQKDDLNDSRYYSTPVSEDEFFANYGYTTSIIEKDIKLGVFK